MTKNYSYYEQFAGELAKDINEKTWDEETGFYYDLHHETDEKAMVNEYSGSLSILGRAFR